MRVRSKNEVEKYYNKVYINQFYVEFLQFFEVDLQRFFCLVVYKLCDDFFRYFDFFQIFQLMGGYMVGRGDFNVEYDNFMELELRVIDFNESFVLEKDYFEERLKFEVLDVYQNCIFDRCWRKRIIRKYGLINIRKYRFDYGMYLIKFKELLDFLRFFIRFCNFEGFDKYIQVFNL